MIIESGDHRSNKMIIDVNGRAMVNAITHPHITSHAEDGDAFFFMSDFVALTTTASYTGLIYIKNTSTLDLTISSVRSSGTVAQQWRMIKNPTTGTLITAGTDIVPVNTNFGSGTVALAELKVGADAQTVTDGALMGQWANAAATMLLEFNGSIILTPGTAFALEVKPASAGDVGTTILGSFGDGTT